MSSSIGKVASTANLAGVEFENLLGLITASNEIVQNAGKVATGYKSILTNLLTKDLEDQFNDFGLTMRDQNDELKDGYTLLMELGGAYNSIGQVWDENTDSMVSLNDEMNKLLEDIGGKYNINTLTALFSNLDTAVQATDSAFNSAGSASEEYAKALDSIEKKSDAVAGKFQELVWGDGGLQNLIKGFLDLSVGVLSFANSSKLLNVVLGATAVILGVNLIPKLITLGVTMATNIGEASLLAMETGSLSAGFTALGISASVAQIAITGLTLVISAGIIAYNLYNNKQKELLQTAVDLSSAYQSTNDSLEETINNIKDETASRESLINVLESLGGSYDEENDKLKTNNELREDALELAYAEAQAKAKELQRTTGAEYSKAQETLTGGFESSIYGDVLPSGSTRQDVVNFEKTIIDSYNERIQAGEKLSKTETFALQKVQDEYSSLISDIEDAKSITTAYDDATETLSMTFEEYISNIQDTTDAQDESTESLVDYISSIDDLITAHESLNDATNSLVSSISTLSSAFQEQADEGQLSADTILSLIDSGYELALVYNEQTGAVTLNKDAVIALTEANIEARIAEEELAQTGIIEELKKQGIASLLTAQGFLELTKANKMLTDEQYTQVELYNESQARILALQASLNSIGTSFTKTAKATSSTTDALKEQKEAVEDLRDAELDQIDSRIDALKKQKSAEEDYWDAKIKALEDQNDAIQSQIDLEKLEANLATAQAKKVKIYKAGEGFVYESDSQAVSEASSALNEYKAQQKRDAEIRALEDQRDKIVANFDKQIDDLEDYRDSVDAQYDKQIDDLESFYNEKSNLQAKEVTAQSNYANQEKTIYQNRLANLKAFKEQQKLLLADVSTGVSSSSFKTSSGGGTKVATAYASGVDSIKENQIGIVGDAPNTEMVIGSKLNGSVMSLGKGTGVVNAESTSTLAGILNSIGRFGGNSIESTNNNSSSQNISIGNITLPSVKDGQDFVNYFKGFNAIMAQQAYT